MKTLHKRILCFFILALLPALFLAAWEKDFTNGSFEQDLQGWKTGTFSSWTLPEIAVDSTDMGKAVKLSAPDNNTRGWVEQRFSVQPNEVYIVEASLKCRDVTYNRMGIQVIEYPANSDKAKTLDIKKTLPIQIAKNTQDWLPYQAVVKTGSTTASLTLRVYLGTHGPVKKGATAWASGLKITKHEGDGAINLLPNGDFEAKTTAADSCWKDKMQPAHWTLWKAKKTKKLRAFMDSSEKYSGLQSVRFELPSESRFALHCTLPLDSSKKYRFSAAMKTKDIQGSVYVRIMYLDGKGKQLKGKLPTTHILRDTRDWEEYGLNLTPPAGGEAVPGVRQQV